MDILLATGVLTQHTSSLLHNSVTTGIIASYQPFNMHQYIQLFIVRVLLFFPLWPNAAFCAIVSTSLYLQKLLTFLSLKQHLLTRTGLSLPSSVSRPAVTLLRAAGSRCSGTRPTRCVIMTMTQNSGRDDRHRWHWACPRRYTSTAIKPASVELCGGHL